MKGRVCSVVLKFGLIVWLFASVAQAQSIDISKFYYRDYLDFGQGYGAFNGENSGKANTSNGTTLTGKDGTQVSVPNVPNFSASSNYGSLTSVGRGFAVTANHVSSPESQDDLRKWGLSTYKIANQPINDTNGDTIYGVSKPYGRDEKFLRFDKYVVEGQVDLLDIENTTSQSDKDSSDKEKQNLEKLKTELDNFKHTDGNVYLYQAGSGIIKLRGTSDYQGQINGAQNGETKGGGFGTLNETALQYAELVKCENCATGDNRGMVFNYNPDSNFNNRITSGDSGSGIYAYDKTKNKWVLLGVVSQTYEQLGQNEAKISFVSNKDLQDYQKNFEQNINLKMTEPNLNKWMLNNTTLEYDARGDTPNGYHALQNNKDIIFSGGGTIEVQANIYRNISGYAGGFVFTADSSATSAKPTRYIFTNKDNKANIFIGSGLDIGQNVVVEWALGTQNGDSLHKIGKGELIIKTQNVDSTKLGTLKIGEGKVTLDTTTKAFDNIYITSGRGELALKAGKAEALGAEKNGVNSVSGTTSANSYKLAQDSTDKMGFYFGTGGGKLDLAGNSLVLNTIAANDSKAIITNSDASTQSTLEIQGLGYGTNGTKTSAKADTIIHASFGEISPSPAEGDKGGGSNTQNSGQANINIKYSGNRTTQNVQNPTLPLAPSAREGESQSASLIFDGHINIQGELKAENGNIVLQGHPTTHATISDKSIRDKIQSAENGTQKGMPNYMDLSKPSTLNQPDWDSRNFTIGSGITLANATLTVGKAANLTADITADNTSQINFGGKHFIDERDGTNVRGSGFSYYQLVTSGELGDNELYKDSSYSGTIKAEGTKITSKFMNFAPNLTLTNGANLDAKYLTLTQSSTMNFTDSSATIDNLVFQGVSDLNKITLKGTSKFEVKESFTFYNSTFDLDTLKTTTINNLTLPTEYNLYAFNDSKITATNEFKNTNANAEFVLDGKSTTFTATGAVNFKGAKMSVQNEAEFTADSLKFDAKSTIDLTNSAKFTLKNGLQTQDLNLNLSNSSTMSANSLTSNGASTINLNNKAELTLTDILTSKDLTLTLKNESKFTANTLTASGVVKLQGDKNATLTLDTLTLDNAQANISAKADIKNLTLNNTKETAIGENVSITTLNLNQSNANLKLLNGQIPKTINLNTQSNLYLNELNLNTNSITLTSDDSSKAHIQRLIYDAKSTQNGAKTAPQSNLSVSELFKLDNVGTNLGTNSEQDRLNKDLLALEFGKTLTLQSSATLEVNFAELIKHNNSNLQFDKSYTIFSAKDLSYNDFSNIKLNFFGTNGDKLFATGKFQDNAFLVEFRRDDPRNFGNLNPHIKNPAHLPLLEILLQHNKNDESIEKVVNSGDYTALNQRLAQIDTSLKTIANADSAALKTLSLLQKQEINARIQQNRFTTAKFALAKITNPAQKSDIVPTLLYLDENERQNRVWSGASASFFGNGSDKFSLQSVSIGYDRKLFGDEFLLGILASLTNTQLSSDETSLNPKIYTLALYSDALFRQGELQNELSFSLLNGDKGFESENGSYKSFYGFFESVYKVQTAFLPQSIKPIVLGRVNLRHFDEFSTATYKQKADDDISVDLGVGVEWLWQRESGFYSASFVAERDIYHSQKERLMSLTGAQKFVAYETNEPSFAYQLYLAGLESFKNGIYLRYGLSGFVDSKAYKGFKADVQVGYRF